MPLGMEGSAPYTHHIKLSSKSADDKYMLSCMQAVRLLVFVHSEAEGLPLKPQLKLAPSDKARLQYCSLQLRGRQALCKSALHQADTASLN